MDDWDDLDDWSDGRAQPNRVGLVVVAVIVLVPFVLLVGGGLHAIDALGPGLLAVVVFFAAVAVAYLLIRRWLRHRLLDGVPGSGGSFWSDRR